MASGVITNRENHTTILESNPPQMLLDELADFERLLRGHTDRMTELRKHITSPNVDAVTVVDRSNGRPGGVLPDAHSPPNIDVHMRRLNDFVETHISNLIAFRTSMVNVKQEPPTRQTSRRRVAESHVQTPVADMTPEEVEEQHSEEEMKNISQQFSVIVVFSTFAAGLILAYLQLMQSLIPDPSILSPKALVHYYLGFGIGFSALIWNVSITIIAGANTAACASGKPWKTMDSIHGRLVLLVFAQVVGAALFCATIGILQYITHAGHYLAPISLGIFPPAVMIAGLDLAKTSREFRLLIGDCNGWMKEVLCCGRRKR